MVYILGWISILFFLFIHEVVHYRGKVFLYCALMFFCILAFFRGNVGTDTANYEMMFAEFSLGYSWDGLEPLFLGLGRLLSALTPSVELAVRATALVFFGLLGWFVAYSDRNERFLLLSYILPAFAYQYSMNALRLGIASIVLLMAVQIFRRKSRFTAFWVGTSAVLFHYSLSLSLLLVIMLQRSWFKLSSAIGMLCILAVAIGGLLFIDAYMLSKLDSYREMQALGVTSGLSKIAPLIIILAGVIFGNLPRVEKFKIFFLGASLILGAWVLTQFSYAGLRVLDLLSFSVPLAILATYSRLNLNFDGLTKLSMVCAGLVSMMGLWRGFMLDYGQGESPFMPYSFM